jgi:hypothetical protein
VAKKRCSFFRQIREEATPKRQKSFGLKAGGSKQPITAIKHVATVSIAPGGPFIAMGVTPRKAIR